MSAYTPYELLHVIIDRVAWPTQAEQVAAHASVTEYESINMFGNLATMMACQHEEVVSLADYKRPGQYRCVDCGRLISR